MSPYLCHTLHTSAGHCHRRSPLLLYSTHERSTLHEMVSTCAIFEYSTSGDHLWQCAALVSRSTHERRTLPRMVSTCAIIYTRARDTATDGLHLCHTLHTGKGHCQRWSPLVPYSTHERSTLHTAWDGLHYSSIAQVETVCGSVRRSCVEYGTSGDRLCQCAALVCRVWHKWRPSVAVCGARVESMAQVKTVCGSVPRSCGEYGTSGDRFWLCAALVCRV